MVSIETGPKRNQCLLYGILITFSSGSKVDCCSFIPHVTFLDTSLLDPSESVHDLQSEDITKVGGI